MASRRGERSRPAVHAWRRGHPGWRPAGWPEGGIRGPKQPRAGRYPAGDARRTHPGIGLATRCRPGPIGVQGCEPQSLVKLQRACLNGRAFNNRARTGCQHSTGRRESGTGASNDGHEVDGWRAVAMSLMKCGRNTARVRSRRYRTAIFRLFSDNSRPKCRPMPLAAVTAGHRLQLVAFTGITRPIRTEPRNGGIGKTSQTRRLTEQCGHTTKSTTCDRQRESRLTGIERPADEKWPTETRSRMAETNLRASVAKEDAIPKVSRKRPHSFWLCPAAVGLSAGARNRTTAGRDPNTLMSSAFRCA